MEKIMKRDDEAINREIRKKMIKWVPKQIGKALLWITFGALFGYLLTILPA